MGDERGKVAVVVTRPDGRGALEVLVFAHPLAGVQLPAGTVEPGEDVAAAARRELLEESGLDLEVGPLAEVARRPDPTGQVRGFFHGRLEREVSETWELCTPDGGGLRWRLHWVGLDVPGVLHPAQQPWLDLVRAEVAAAEDAGRPLAPSPVLDLPYPREEAEEVAIHLPDGVRRFLHWRRPIEDAPPVAVSRVHGVGRTADGGIVLVRHEADGPWGLPGGGIEAGESPEEAFVRELAEEACARVVRAEAMEHRVGVRLAADGTEAERFAFVAFAADVELDPWEPRFEIVERTTVPVREVDHHLRQQVFRGGATALLGPGRSVRAAFGVEGTAVALAGGMDPAFRFGGLVLKRVGGETEAVANAALVAGLEVDASQVRLARPAPTRDGRWWHEGWTASAWVEGAVLRQGQPTVAALAADRALHAALAAVPEPAHLRARTDRWALAERAAFGEVAAPDDLPAPLAALLAPLLAARRPVDAGPPQVVHSDLFSNLLFADNLPPAVIDFSPTWRPAGWATAVYCYDALAWGGADPAVLAAADPQLLVRAAIFRLLALDGARREIGMDPAPHLPAHAHADAHVLALPT